MLQTPNDLGLYCIPAPSRWGLGGTYETMKKLDHAEISVRSLTEQPLSNKPFYSIHDVNVSSFVSATRFCCLGTGCCEFCEDASLGWSWHKSISVKHSELDRFIPAPCCQERMWGGPMWTPVRFSLFSLLIVLTSLSFQLPRFVCCLCQSISPSLGVFYSSLSLSLCSVCSVVHPVLCCIIPLVIVIYKTPQKSCQMHDIL